jgi:hypothetical protein
MKKEEKQLSELTDEELLREAKKMKSTAILNALLIGILVGIAFYSIVKNSLGLVAIVPLFFAYRMINNSKHNGRELESILKERNLK